MSCKKICELLNKLNYVLDSRQKRLGVLVFVCSILAALFETLGVSIIVPLIDVLVAPEKLLKNKYIGRIAPAFGIDSKEGLVIAIITMVIIVYIIKNLFFIFNTWLKIKYSFMVQRELSVRMMRRYIGRGYRFFLDHNYSELRQGIDGDVRSLYYIVSNIMQISTQISLTLMISIYMLVADWKLAIGAIAAGLLCLVFIMGIYRKKMAESGRILRLLSIKAEQTMEETLHGIKEVLIARKQDFFIERFDDEVKERNKVDVVKTSGAEMPAYMIEMIAITGIMIVLCIRVLSMEDASEYVAVLGSFAVGMFRILPALGKLSSSFNSIIGSLPGLNVVYENLKDDKDANATYVSNELKDSNAEDNGFDDAIRVEGLSFRYNEDTDYVLKKLNLTIKKGMSVALVGESGAGKTTLADIILDLLEPSEGKVFVDKTDIRDLSRIWWRRIGYVPQTIFLTDSTIMENVAYGVKTEDIDESKVRDALRRANLLGFIDSLDDGIHTVVGDRGVRLSGGQRQRIGIARALYNSPDILVLDEATSALDNETETAVMESVESLMGDITMIIIAHRLTTIRNCDMIYEIKGGKAIPRKYDEL